MCIYIFYSFLVKLCQIIYIQYDKVKPVTLLRFNLFVYKCDFTLLYSSYCNDCGMNL